MSDKAENICLAVVLALLAVALGSWGIYSYTHRETAAEYSYALKGTPTCYPDVVFELTFTRALSPEEKTAVGEAVAEKMFENIEDDENHYLHYMDILDTDAESDSMTIYIDFGCNDGEGYDVLLRFLDESVSEIKAVRVS